jgi:hypothetical protein
MFPAYQQTIKEEVALTGTGLHSGLVVLLLSLLMYILVLFFVEQIYQIILKYLQMLIGQHIPKEVLRLSLMVLLLVLLNML